MSFLCFLLWQLNNTGQTFWAWLWRCGIFSGKFYWRILNDWDAIFSRRAMRLGCTFYYRYVCKD